MLTSRERVLCSLNHQEPDRVPIFIGASGATTMLAPAYERLRSYLGIQSQTKVFSRALQYAEMDEEVMVRFGSDARAISPGPAPSGHRRELTNDAFVDEWGVTWERRPSATYYEVVECPLANASVDDIERYTWPDLCHPDRFEGLAAKARAIRENGYAVVAMAGVSPFEQIGLLRGLSAWLIDLAVNTEFAQALLNQVAGLMKASVVRLLEEAGDYVDVVITSDDLGTQKAPMISPAMYRRLVKPYHADLLSAIKDRTKAKVFFHSDGNIYPLLGDLIEIGVDLLNPVQVSATDMGDTARLKREFGDRLSFCGGIDTQDVLPRGAVDDVRREVRRRIQDLAPGGGYVLAAVHCIQPDVPPENVCAMFDEAIKAGRYPLTF